MNEITNADSYNKGRHDERQRTARLIGQVRDKIGPCCNDTLDELVMLIVDEPLQPLPRFERCTK